MAEPVFKAATIVGARPQFLKYFPLARAIESHNKEYPWRPVSDILIHSGQHYDYAMSRIFFDELGIREPEYHLGVGSGSHGTQTGQIMDRTEQVLMKEKPDMVIVFGDTNSTLGGALAAAKLHIPVAHIEAGLRSYNKKMPEEINRVLTDHVSSYLLCPGKNSVSNLMKEGFKPDGSESNPLPGGPIMPVSADEPIVANVGDVMYDVLLHSMKIAKKSSVMDDLPLKSKEYFLLTLHRAENTDEPERFRQIAGFVNGVSEGRTVIFPAHPRTAKKILENGNPFGENIKITGPMGHFDLLKLLSRSTLVLTDSGGLQKEAFWLKIPCITLRDETEWVETVESGWNILYKNYTGPHSPLADNLCYGDGNAAVRIISLLARV